MVGTTNTDKHNGEVPFTLIPTHLDDRAGLATLPG